MKKKAVKFSGSIYMNALTDAFGLMQVILY